MLVLLSLLLVAASSVVSPASSTATEQSPDAEVEAWDPRGTSEAGVWHQPRNIHDDEAQAFAAIVPVAGGVFLGALGAAAAIALSGALPSPVGAVSATVVGALLVAATPAVLVSLALPELPGWTPWLTAALVPAGAVVFGAAMLGASVGLVQATRRPVDDCAMCGLGGIVVVLGTPLAAAAGAIAGGLTATTIAAYAARE